MRRLWIKKKTRWPPHSLLPLLLLFSSCFKSSLITCARSCRLKKKVRAWVKLTFILLAGIWWPLMKNLVLFIVHSREINLRRSKTRRHTNPLQQLKLLRWSAAPLRVFSPLSARWVTWPRLTRTRPREIPSGGKGTQRMLPFWVPVSRVSPSRRKKAEEQAKGL